MDVAIADHRYQGNPIMRAHESIWLAATAAALLAGCVGAESPATGDMGTVQVRLITPQVGQLELTRVSVESNTGASADLTRDAQTGQFTGSLLLPAGMHELTGRAFIDDDLVGVSNPVPADVQAGGVTQVMIQILDITGGNQPDFGPILASLSHPTSTSAGTEVLFAASVIDPDGTPVSYDWTDDCDDSTFTAPQAAETGWSKLTPGACRVTLVASSGGVSITNSFSVVVFQSGADQGAVEIVNEFISAPTSSLQLVAGSEQCFTTSSAADASCRKVFASPEFAQVLVGIDWANGSPGTATLSDDCGGSVGVGVQNPSTIIAAWLPPIQGGLCRLTVRATNGQGVLGQLSMAIVVLDGVPRQPATPPTISAEMFLPTEFGRCLAASDQPASDCGTLAAFTSTAISARVFWGDSLPGSIEFTDGCGGQFFGTGVDLVSGFAGTEWAAPGTSAADCPITVTARSLEGLTTSAVFLLDVLL
jgi:hypothetical protein